MSNEKASRFLAAKFENVIKMHDYINEHKIDKKLLPKILKMPKEKLDLLLAGDVGTLSEQDIVRYMTNLCLYIIHNRSESNS